MLGSVGSFGRVYEFGLMAAYKLRTRDFFSDLAKFPTMLLKGKMKLFPPSTCGTQGAWRRYSSNAGTHGGQRNEDTLSSRAARWIRLPRTSRCPHWQSRRRWESSWKRYPDWTCCGSTPAHATDALLAASLPARNLAIAEEAGTGCGRLLRGVLRHGSQRRTWRSAEDADLRAEVAETIGREYAGGVKVRHFLQVLLEDIGLAEIKDLVTRSLGGLKVACYYGCLLTRPKELSIVDDPEDPQLMERPADGRRRGSHRVAVTRPSAAARVSRSRERTP